MNAPKGAPAFIHPTALVYGAASIGEGSSLWPYAVIRAENYKVRIGRFTNLQDFVMIHIGHRHDTVVGDYCSITHHVNLHGCTIGDCCLIGIGTTVMDGCVIGDNCIVAGHSFLKENTVIPPNSVVMGTPAKVVRTVDSALANLTNALLYHHNALAYRRGEHRIWDQLDRDALAAEARAALAELATQKRQP